MRRRHRRLRPKARSCLGQASRRHARRICFAPRLRAGHAARRRRALAVAHERRHRRHIRLDPARGTKRFRRTSRPTNVHLCAQAAGAARDRRRGSCGAGAGRDRAGRQFRGRRHRSARGFRDQRALSGHGSNLAMAGRSAAGAGARRLHGARRLEPRSKDRRRRAVYRLGVELFLCRRARLGGEPGAARGAA